MDEIIQGGPSRYLVEKERSARNVPPEKIEAFLRYLADSCNVTRSARRASLAYSTLYDMRQRDEAFAVRWQAALEAGYDRLEMALVEAALLATGAAAAIDSEAGDGEAGDGEAGNAVPEPQLVAPAMSVEQAMTLLRRHHASVQGGKGRGSRPGKGRMPTSAETDAAIRERLAILRRQRGWDAL
jgi:hypothetical protein